MNSLTVIFGISSWVLTKPHNNQENYMQIQYAQTGARERYYHGPVSARSKLLAAGYIIQLDRDGFTFQNPMTGDVVTLIVEI